MSEGRRDLDTLAASISDRPASGPRASATGLLLPDRYVEPKRIASGGMGEIWRFRDARLGRDVVLKRLHTEAGGREETRLAFEKEAQMQASLGHPGIVSVFDLAEDELGQTYFTMQEVQGTTLADALESVPTSPSRSPWSRRALLEVLARVSLTVAFAHQRGVLHLDLKPENIMLGHFGEVYVLDWGIARRTSDAPQDAESAALLGTLPYMSPEQARQETPDERSDVFALGAMLFEVLSGELMRRGSGMSELLRLARRDPHPQAAARLNAAGVPYELVALCTKATAFDKEQRIATAVAFHAALESWLDGERDLGRRREEAENALAKARAAHAAGEPLAVVMRQLSRAVALAPDHGPALTLLSELMIEAANAVPEGARQQLAREAETSGKRGALLGIITYAAWFCMLPLALLVGVSSYTAMALIVGPALGAMLVSAWAYRSGWTNRLLAAAIVSSFICIAGFATAFGPLLVLPGLLTANIMPLLHLSGERRQFRHLVLGCALLGLMIPLGLEWLALVPPSYEWRDGTMIILPRLIELPAVGSTVILLIGSVLNILSCHFTVAASVQQQLRSRTEALAQAHVLTEVMPEALRAVAPRRLEGELAASVRDSLSGVNAGRPSSY